MEENIQKPHLSGVNPRVIFGVILFLGLGSFVLGFTRLSANINSSAFEGNGANISELPDFTEIEQNLLAQTEDSDEDGISDFDELNIYRTSPYIKDTDGDGIDDKTEIDANEDPTCPKGSNCAQILTDTEVPIQDDGLNIVDVSEIDPNEGAADITADELRQLLIRSGSISEAQLAEIDDETLMQVYLGTIESSSLPEEGEE